MIYLSHYLVHTPITPNDRFMKPGLSKYQALTRELDWHVGEVMNSLKEQGLDKNTLVFFISDNGPARYGSASPLRGGKYYTLEGGCRIPAIVRWPGTVAAGTTCNTLSRTLDVFPTIAEVAGVKLSPKHKIDGKTLMPRLKGRVDAKGHDVLFYYNGLTLEVVRKGKWTLHLPRQGDNRAYWAVASRDGYGNLVKPELFNLENDIAEKRNVADKHPEIVKKLLALAEGARQELGDWNRKGSDQRPVDFKGNVNNPTGRKFSKMKGHKKSKKKKGERKAESQAK